MTRHDPAFSSLSVSSFFPSARAAVAALVLSAASALAPGAVRAQDAPGDSVFAGVSIHSLNFVFDEPWSSVDQQMKANKEAEVYVLGRLEINCDATLQNEGCLVMDSVGFRYKGNSTFNSTRSKNPFRVSFDEYGIDQRWNGIKGFTLNNANMDASHMAEKIHMDFAVVRAGMPGPRMAYADVRVNGDPHAFYMMGELADKRLLKRFFDDKDGDLFKAIDGLSNNSDFTTASFTNKRYENKSDSVERGWARLGAAIEAANGTDPAEELPALINMNGVYRGIGTDILFGSMDSYIGAGQNYLVYFPEDPDSKMEWILWDASLSFGKINFGGGGFGGFPGGGGGGQSGTACSNSATSPIVCGTSSRPLFHKVVTTPALHDDYIRALWFLYKAYYEGDWLASRIDTVADLIRPYLEADEKKLSSMSAFEGDVNTLKNFVSQRQASIASQFEDLGLDAETAVRTGDVVLNELSPAQGWVEIRNARDYSIDLSGHSLSDDPSQPGKWSFPPRSFVDPGGHLVVRLQDGVLGAAGPASFSLPTGGGHLRLSRAGGSVVDSLSYQAQSGDSSIARGAGGALVAAFPTPGEANAVATTGGTAILPRAVVINEFMADNDTIDSPAGVRADWVELFNTTSSPVDLAGAHLSDDPGEPSKWTFPEGASVPAEGYLVVWAYDTVFAGNALYTSWALSKDGEHIRLSNSDLSVVDSVTFGPQEENRSMARIPSGTGDFSAACPPTLGAHNGNCVTAVEDAPLARARGPLSLERGGAGRLVARITLESSARVRLAVHDARGREVAVPVNGPLSAGSHARVVDASSWPAGMYWFRLRIGDAVHVRAGLIAR